ncbi:MFS transporter [Henriciella aquimarina]|uniref:MFS transporter n=1 Tax=Henriciella aquimarina TaxID=545261 RepID=UPI0009FDCE0A|nr:MFS transporter [Henriciella aquimarina]
MANQDGDWQPEEGEDLDGLEEDRTGQVKSPVSGIDSATEAGATLQFTARSLFARRTHRRVKSELPAYLMIQCSWFTAFGLQMVLFPYLITNRLGLDGTELGLANMALSGPSVVFLLLGGVIAERTRGKPLLMTLHLCSALPPIALAFVIANGNLAYPFMLIYGFAMGTVGAFMMPARDSIINEIVERRSRIGSGVTLQQGVAFATIAQFAAQIAGLIVGGYADKLTRMPDWMGGFSIGPIPSWELLAFQGIIVGLGAGFAIFLGRGRGVKTGRSGLGAAVGDIKEGFQVVLENSKLWAMTALMFGVGIFVIGSFLVVLPIINRDIYGLSSDGIRDMFVTFWLGAFVSSVALSVFRHIKRQGRLLLTAQLLGSLAILIMLAKPPHWIFLAIVFAWGLAAGVSIAMSRSIVQDAAPKNQLARVLSIYQLGFMAGAPFGAALMGWLVDFFPEQPQRVAVVPALGMTILIVWMVVRTPIWNMKHVVPPQTGKFKRASR